MKKTHTPSANASLHTAAVLKQLTPDQLKAVSGGICRTCGLVGTIDGAPKL